MKCEFCGKEMKYEGQYEGMGTEIFDDLNEDEREDYERWFTVDEYYCEDCEMGVQIVID